MANESINLNLIPKGEMPVIHVSQFDNGRQFTINLLKGSDEYTLPQGYTAVLNCRKADRNIVTLATTSVLSNALTFTTTTQLCACAGKNLCEVVIKDTEDYQIGTLNFILEVERDPLQGGIESTSEIHDLEDQIEDITTEIISENYYTKTETDTLLDAKADASDLATVATTGSYTDLNNLPKLNGMTITGNRNAQWYGLASKLNDLSDVTLSPELSEFETLIYNSALNKWINSKMSYNWLIDQPSIPDPQVQSDYAQSDDTKVDYIKNKPDLSIYTKETELILATGTENEAPYQIRQAPSNIGNLALEKLVGVSCVFNQLVQNGNFANNDYWSFSNSYGTMSIANNKATLNLTSNNQNMSITQLSSDSVYSGHVYFEKIDVTCSKVIRPRIGYSGDNVMPYVYMTPNVANQKTTCYCFHKLTNSSGETPFKNYIYFNLVPNSLDSGDKVVFENAQIFDLTAMFGSTVADYIYTLESGNAGAGVSLFKSLFADEYYPYTANTLMSAKPTSKVIKDSNNQTVATIVYSGNELRGLLKVGTDGLYADGDIDDGSGSTQVRYELRAYQSGDESLPDAITDGTNTVVKLATPTTAVSTAWSNPIIAKEGGTEEFTDARTVKMFTGHDTIYSKKQDYRYWG